MTRPARHTAPWPLWPLAALWDLLSFVLRLTGRVVAVAAGVVVMIVGGLLVATVLGAPVGVPLIVVGFLLVLRGLF